MSDIFSIKGKKTFIAGATGGIGQTIAKHFSKAGSDLIIAGRRESLLNKIKADIENNNKIMPLSFDISKTNSINLAIKKVINEFDKIDILINCAGTNIRKHFLDVSEGDYDLVMDVNSKGLYFLSQKIAKIMANNRKGKIINIASLNSFIALNTVSVYATSKGAVSQMTKAMAVDLAKYNIQVNAIAPGFIKTPFNKLLWGNKEKSRWIIERTLANRFGEPGDLVGALRFLSSEASDFITGQIIVVDGGFLAGEDTLFD